MIFNEDLISTILGENQATFFIKNLKTRIYWYVNNKGEFYKVYGQNRVYTLERVFMERN